MLYYKHTNGSIILIAMYVDDLLIAGNDRSIVNNIKDGLKHRFKMDLGDASEFLGIQIYRDRVKRTSHISQSKHIDKILERFRITDSNAMSTPMEITSSKPSSTDMYQEQLAHDVPYRQAIGSLMYLMVGTRPDICYAVGKLSQYRENPLKSHWSSVKRVLRYIKSTQQIGISYNASDGIRPVGYCDSNCAGCVQFKRSFRLLTEFIP